jgi:hypothetical protein
MGRLRRIGYSVGIALIVFIFLSLPTLRRVYGPVVNLPVYAVIALLVGGLAWVLFTELSRDPSREVVWVDADSDPDEELPEDRKPDVNVDDEIEQLREEN